MKTVFSKYILLLLFFPCSILLGIDPQSIGGTWYRTYGIYRPWTDDNQGTFSYYKEMLIFHPNDIVYIYETDIETPKGKSVYTFTTRNNKDFIVFHRADQDPNNNTVQKKQGFFITLTTDSKNHDVLTLTTIKEAKKKSAGIQYKKLKENAKEPKFVVPQNDI